MLIASGIIVFVAAAAFLAIAAAAFVRPAWVRRFFGAFASSAWTHLLEQALRLVFGLALVVYAPAMWRPIIFWSLGWLIVVTAVVLFCTPWRWHRRFARAVMPTVHRHVRLFGLAVAGFAALLLVGLLAGPGPGSSGQEAMQNAAP
ncbi:MAG: hypothetical protein RIE32_07570 [Phycisphaerales bacterium]